MVNVLFDVVLGANGCDGIWGLSRAVVLPTVPLPGTPVRLCRCCDPYEWAVWPDPGHDHVELDLSPDGPPRYVVTWVPGDMPAAEVARQGLHLRDHAGFVARSVDGEALEREIAARAGGEGEPVGEPEPMIRSGPRCRLAGDDGTTWDGGAWEIEGDRPGPLRVRFADRLPPAAGSLSLYAGHAPNTYGYHGVRRDYPPAERGSR